MMMQSIDRRQGTRGGLATSFAVHAGLIALLFFTLQRATVNLDAPEELTKISYIEAKYGEDVAAKVKLRTQPKPISKGKGVATRPAQSSQPESPRPVHDKPSGIEDAAAPVMERTAPPVAQATPPRLSSRERREMATAVIPPDLNARSTTSIDGDADAPKLSSRGAAPEFKSPTSGLSSRRTGIDVDGAGAPVADTRRRGGGVEEGSGPAAPALRSRGGGSTGSYQAPSSGLSSRNRSGGIAEGTAGVAPPSGGGRESGRRTILDYGSGGGGLSSRSRGGGLAESPNATIVKKPQERENSIEDAAPTKINSKGMSMTISGQIKGRKILHSVAPTYTQQARKKGWEGVVAVHFTVLADGRVKDNVYLEQTSAHRDLNKAAMDAIKQFKFAPLGADKAAVEQWGVITIVFRLN